MLASHTQVTLFASGSGSNAENIIHYFSQHPSIKINLIITNNAEVGVIQRAVRLNIPYLVIDKNRFHDEKSFYEILSSNGTDFIILAGFLLKIPLWLVKKYNNKIINLHPSLLPKFGGKGMYGMNVHNAVIASGEKESGITVHLVNENYDEGRVLMQAKCIVDKELSAQKLAEKIHRIEYSYFPVAIEHYILFESV
jgi:phosphoribosylglycinamide formyltransferase 1